MNLEEQLRFNGIARQVLLEALTRRKKYPSHLTWRDLMPDDKLNAVVHLSEFLLTMVPTLNKILSKDRRK